MAKATMGPIDGAVKRTYRNQAASLVRGTAVIQGTADDQCNLPGGANVAALGIAEEDVSAAAKAASIVRRGECIAIAGGVVNAGDYVEITGVSGKLTTTTTTGHHVVGRAMSSAAADGDEFVLDVSPFVY